jgi:hypothetical protein
MEIIIFYNKIKFTEFWTHDFMEIIIFITKLNSVSHVFCIERDNGQTETLADLPLNYVSHNPRMRGWEHIVVKSK